MRTKAEHLSEHDSLASLLALVRARSGDRAGVTCAHLSVPSVPPGTSSHASFKLQCQSTANEGTTCYF